MTTYNLVGGAWLGGWCWQPIARRLGSTPASANAYAGFSARSGF
jgi:hypothetical protein